MSTIRFPAGHSMDTERLTIAINTLLGANPDERKPVWPEGGGYGVQTVWYNNLGKHRILLTEEYSGGCVVKIPWGKLDPLTSIVLAWVKGKTNA